jgi:DnaJ-class molecular chaperone
MPSTCERCGASSLPLRKKCPTCKGSKKVYSVAVQDASHSRTVHVDPGQTRFGDILRRFGTAVGCQYFELYDEHDKRLDLDAVVVSSAVFA